MKNLFRYFIYAILSFTVISCASTASGCAKSSCCKSGQEQKACNKDSSKACCKKDQKKACGTDCSKSCCKK